MSNAVGLCTHAFHAMGTEILLAAQPVGMNGLTEVEAGFRAAREFIAGQERRFTRFSESSELSQLNRSAGSWFDASPEMLEVLAEAFYLHHQTGGLFDPAVLPALERVGYDRTFEEVQARNEQPAGAIGLPTAAGARFSEIELEPGRVRLPPGMRIDLGGIAKGWIAEQTAQVLAAHSPACLVDAGGDLFMVGLPDGAAAWDVALEDPRDPAGDLTLLRLSPGAVATSSVTRRRWERGGQRYHHLIDPRSGQPADSEWLSVTVAASHAAEAEVFAKALLIGGALEAERAVRLNTGIRYVAVDRQGKLWGSQTSRELFNV